AASPALASSAPQGADSLGTNARVSPVPANAGWLPGGAGAPAAPEPALAGADHAAVADLPAAPTFAGDDQQYAARLLHVYRDADGVQAWVRDASLGQQQAQQLVRAMASELGSAGTPLTALTVNGRRQTLPAARASQERTDADADADADETGVAAPVARLTPYLNGAF
ncbi:hypothetical protein GTP58_09575, partial [Duganella sp. CY15W]|uniref:hypothetical protein n=1 Tax=Duganella sp. CY15W TaxID=2692172 RepID=UPI0013FCC8F9